MSDTTVTRTPEGWTVVRCGDLELFVPTDLDGGADERVEVRCNGHRLWVEAGDEGPLVSPVERYS